MHNYVKSLLLVSKVIFNTSKTFEYVINTTYQGQLSYVPRLIYHDLAVLYRIMKNIKEFQGHQKIKHEQTPEGESSRFITLAFN